MRAAFFPHNYTQSMYQPSQSWTHGFRSVNRYMENPCKEKTHVEMMKPKYQSISQYNKGMCQQFKTTCTMRGKVVKLVINPRSWNNVVWDEAVQKLGLNTIRHPRTYRLEWLMKGSEVTISKCYLVSFSLELIIWIRCVLWVLIVLTSARVIYNIAYACVRSIHKELHCKNKFLFKLTIF